MQQSIRISTGSILLGLTTALISVAAFSPQIASAQYSGPYAQVVITTQTAGGTTGSLGSVDVTMNADGAGFSGAPVFGANSASFYSNFNNDTHLATFNGGSYTILATQVTGYSYAYSPGCSGFTPAGSSAQCAITAYPIGGGGYFGGNGTLVVYTSVTNAATYNYPLQNFTIGVTGNSPSPANFQGTSAGTVVSLGAGNYSVSPATVGGFTATQGSGCTGTIQNGETHYCTVTYAYQGGYPYNPYNPSYPYTNSLTCTPTYQQVSQSGAANFTAEGGNGTYSWNTGERTYVNAGQTLSTTLQTSGNHRVSVSSGTQTATCNVYVLYPYGTVSGQPANGSGYYAASNGYPTLPNTGFAPQDGAAIAFALAALIAAGILSAPYVRRTAQSILG